MRAHGDPRLYNPPPLLFLSTQDAHNLAWKLAGVITGALPEGLLASYEAERRPVALANTALSVRNWREAVRVPAALGLHPAAANLLSEAAAAGGRPGWWRCL